MKKSKCKNTGEIPGMVKEGMTQSDNLIFWKRKYRSNVSIFETNKEKRPFSEEFQQWIA